MYRHVILIRLGDIGQGSKSEASMYGFAKLNSR